MKSHPQNGSIKWIIIIIVAVITLGYFGFDLRGAVEAPQTQKNIHYVEGIATSTWSAYLKRPAVYIWNDVFVGLLWDSFTKALHNLSNREQTDLQKSAPDVRNLGK